MAWYDTTKNIFQHMPSILVTGVRARGVGLTGYAGEPQPGEHSLCRIGEHQKMLVVELGGFFLDLQQLRAGYCSRHRVSSGTSRF